MKYVTKWGTLRDAKPHYCPKYQSKTRVIKEHTMKCIMIGAAHRPAVAVLGTWEPFTRDYRSLLKRLCGYGRRKGMASVAIMLNPPPGIYLAGAAKWPLHCDVETRTSHLLDTGVDGVLRVEFEAADLTRTAAEFFSVVAERVELAEFWLRHMQSIGSGGKGGGLAIRAQSRLGGWKLRNLPEDKSRSFAPKVRSHLLAGRVREAIRLTGFPPMIRRSASPELPTAWPVGRYEAVPIDSISVDLSLAAASSRLQLEVEFVEHGGGLSRIRWPDCATEYLCFTAGPGDLALDASLLTAAGELAMANCAWPSAADDGYSLGENGKSNGCGSFAPTT